MKIVHISDTHNFHRDLPPLPEGDILVHTGDCTMAGTDHEAIDFLDWFCDQPFRHKIYIAGNHDCCFYQMTGVEGLPKGIHYLCNSGITLEGINFYGIPLFMQDVAMGLYDRMLMSIPVETDVLLTHQSPYFDETLANRITEIKPKAVLFGHEHGGYGISQMGGTTLSNGAIVDEHYIITNKPNVITI